MLTCAAEADGVVATVVPKLELEGAAAEGLAHDLVAHADAEGGHLPNDVLCVLHCVGYRRWVALSNTQGHIKRVHIYVIRAC